MDASPDAPASAPRPGPRRRPAPSLFRWILLPAVLGTLTGVLVVVVPWTLSLLVLAFVGSGLAVMLRVGADRLVEWFGPTRGVAVMGGILFVSWLVLAVSPPAALRGLGVTPMHRAAEPKDPYALPPAGSTGIIPDLQKPGEPIDPVKPLKEFLTPTPAYVPPPPPEPPADGRRGTPTVTLSLSSSRSAVGDGVILVAEVAGDGRAVRGEVTFSADGKELARRTLRVQGRTSQIEFRLTGLPVGSHSLQARYAGSATFAAAESAAVGHRVVAR
jgi:hypothetical protein